MSEEDKLKKVAQNLVTAKRIVIFSGAGMSAESGISTFRQPEVGVWANKLGLAYFGTPLGWRSK
jgi:NAD-dependent SIR2 family protein deacetylase